MGNVKIAVAARRTDEISSAWWAVTSRFLLHGLVLSTWASRIPAIQSSLGLSNAVLGLCLLGTATGSIVSIPITSSLIARHGSRRVTAWSTFALALTLLPISFANSASALFAALILLGAAAGANDVSINAQGVAVESEMGTPTMSRFHAMFSIGGMVGATIGAFVAAHSISIQVHFLASSVFFVALALATAPFLLEVCRDPVRERQSAHRGSLSGVVITLALIAFCMFLSEGAMADWAAVYLKQVLHADQGIAAAGYAAFSCGMALFRLLGDTVTKRFGPVRTLRLGSLAAIAGLTVALSAHSTNLALPGLALTGAGFSVIVPLVFAAGGRTNERAPESAIAVISGSGYIGFLFGPPIIGLLAEALSLRIALTLLILLSGVAVALASAVRSRDNGATC